MTMLMQRHGESEANAGELFEGGAPDNTDRGPTRLTGLGERQAYAAGIVAGKLGLELTRVTSSVMTRAQRTAQLFAEGYGGSITMIDPLSGIHEIEHGNLTFAVTRQEAAAHRERVVKNMTDILLEAKLDPSLVGHAPWVIPTGDGSGETYLGAAIRGVQAIEEYDPAADEVIVGHHGTGRQTRALGSHVDPTVRQEIYERFRNIPILAGGADPETLAEAIREDATAIQGLVRLLMRSGLPELDYVNARKKGISNGELVEIGIVNGMWIPKRRIAPILPSDEFAAINPDTVEHRELPFRAEAWI